MADFHVVDCLSLYRVVSSAIVHPIKAPAAFRGKTALKRVRCSKPIALALAEGLLRTPATVFDYGCGHGGISGSSARGELRPTAGTQTTLRKSRFALLPSSIWVTS